MGKTDKVPGLAYRLADHMRYLSTFIDTVLPDEKIVLIVNDWGSALGLNWARLHANRIAGLGLMEFLIPIPSWEAFPGRTREMFTAYRDPVQGRKLLIDENAFINLVLPEV
jgi:haloalkane dehalogenase